MGARVATVRFFPLLRLTALGARGAPVPPRETGRMAQAGVMVSLLMAPVAVAVVAPGLPPAVPVERAQMVLMQVLVAPPVLQEPQVWFSRTGLVRVAMVEMLP